MKKLIMTLAAVSALSVGAPAAAQYANSNIDARIQQLQLQLQAGVRAGTITRNEAVPLREQLRQLSRLERQYSRDGLSRGERDQLQQRIRNLRQQIRYAERNGDNRGRYDRDRWDDDDRYGNRGFCPPGLAKKNNGCLPPGQAKKMGDRYDNDWSGVPRQWRDRYRDGNRYIYRYDNGRIYQIDRRTGRVVRVIEPRR